MRINLIPILLLFGFNQTKAQIVTYAELICSATEIVVNDSMLFSSMPEATIALDSNLMKQVFKPLYHTSNKAWGEIQSWAVAGKITRQAQYDVVLLLEKNESVDGRCYNVLHMVTLGKTGNYIASFGLHIMRKTHYSSYQTSSWLYKNLSINQETKIEVAQRKFGNSNDFIIDENGRFIYYATN